MFDNMDSGQWLNALDASPVGVVATQNQAIIWTNATLKKWLGDRAQLLEAQSIENMADNLAPLFDSNDLVHLPAADEYTDLWLSRSSHQLDDQTLLYFFTHQGAYHALLNERDQLKEDLSEVMAIDEVTGMPNHRALFQSLDSQVSRSRRYGNPLSVFVLQVNNLEPLNDQQVDLLMIAISRMLNDQIRWADIVGRLNQTDFLIVLPETHADACQHIASNMHERIASLPIPDDFPQEYGASIRCGFAEWEKGNDVGLLMMRAREALKNA